MTLQNSDFEMAAREPHDLEHKRLVLQAQLDARKSQQERNEMGQFATPTALARDILAYSVSLLPEQKPIRFLDPAIGTGAFYSALLAAAPIERIECSEGIEIDPHYAAPARTLWADTALQLRQDDFTVLPAPTREQERYNLVVCNPPYVRHHHLLNEQKKRLQYRTKTVFGMKIDGLAGLYCYFLALSHSWMQIDAVAAWLIPSEFMSVNYGTAVKKYLLDTVTLLHIHRFDPNNIQFDDALVSSAVVFLCNRLPSADHTVMLSYGGTLTNPTLVKHIPVEELRHESKWTRFPAADIRQRSDGPVLKDFFRITRGLATGDNAFFILTPEQIEVHKLPWECFRPILPSPRYLEHEEICSDEHGMPVNIRRLFLLDCRLPEETVRIRYPSLWAYLQTGKPMVSKRYLCSKRKPWYSQEDRAPCPFVCTYLGRSGTRRGKTFRFLLNHSQATAANVYLLLYPHGALAQALALDPSLLRTVWQWLGTIQPEALLDEGRVYGGGLYKLEPNELAHVRADGLQALLGTPKANLPQETHWHQTNWLDR